MRVKELTLQGYKSFAGKHRLVFPPGITAIVGPNGSGKSNVADGLRWVLGEVRSTQLRAKRQEDLIFAGSDRRSRVGLADVSLTFDNADGGLPIDFSEVVVGRRVMRDGTSHFIINGATVRLRDVVDLLGEKLGQGTFTVIGQGMVDHALALRPEDRRALIDEAAGLVPLQRQRDRALRQLVEVDENLTRVQDILAELGPRLRRMARLAERAATHQKLSAELEGLLHAWYGYHWHQATTQLAAADAGLAELAAELAAAEAARSAGEAALQSAQAGAEADEGRLAEWRRRREALLAAVATARQQAAVLRAQAEAQKVRQLELLTMENETAAALDKRRAQAEALAVELTRLEDEAVERAAERAAAEEIVRAAEAALEAEATRMDAFRRDQLAVAAELARATEQRVAAGTALELQRSERADVNARREGLLRQLGERQAEHAAAIDAERHVGARLEALGGAVAAVETELDALRADLAAAQDARAGARREREAHEARANTLAALAAEVGEEGVRRRLAAAGLDVRGAVAELLEVEPGWEAAVAAVLGPRVQALVIAPQGAPRAALAVLGRDEPGQVWLLPASEEAPTTGASPVAAVGPDERASDQLGQATAPTASVAAIRPATKRRSASAGRAAEAGGDAAPARPQLEAPGTMVGSSRVVSPAALLRAPRAGGLVGRLFDGVLFVEDHAAAVEVLSILAPHSFGIDAGVMGGRASPKAKAGRAAKAAAAGAPSLGESGADLGAAPAHFAVATRSGQVVYADGSVSVGAPGQALIELARERRTLPAALKAAQAVEEAAASEVDRLSAARRSTEHRLGELVDERSVAAKERAGAARQLELAEAELHRVQREADWLAGREAQLDEAVAAHEVAGSGLDARIAELERRAAAVEAALQDARAARDHVDLAGPRHILAETTARAAAAAQALAGARAMQEAAAADLAAATARLNEGQARGAEAESAVERMTAEAAALDGEAAAFEAELAKLDGAITPAEQSGGERRRALREAAAALEGQRASVTRLERRQAEEQLAVSKAEGRLERLFDQLTADGEWLPWVADQPTGLGARELLKIVAARAATDAGGSPFKPVHDLPDDLERRIGLLRRELRAIGAIDAEALATYEESAEHQTFLAREEADLLAAQADLKRALETLAQEMTQRFETAFEAVAAAFSHFFPQLFGGGEARLVMSVADDGDAGVDIVARPPGKRSQPLSLLSGGERALTAVALIFALVKVSGTPFVVLDEVDAALDEANVGRFADALRRLAEDTQVVIITHNRATIQTASTVYGVSMGDDGASQTISVRVDELAA